MIGFVLFRYPIKNKTNCENKTFEMRHRNHEMQHMNSTAYRNVQNRVQYLHVERRGGMSREREAKSSRYSASERQENREKKGDRGRKR